MGINYQQLKATGDSIEVERRESITTERDQYTFVKRKKTLLRERFSHPNAHKARASRKSATTDTAPTDVLRGAVIQTRHSKSQLERAVDRTSAQLKRLAHEIDNEIDCLKAQRDCLMYKKPARPKRNVAIQSNQGCCGPSVNCANRATIDFTVEKFSSQHKFVCTSPRYGRDEQTSCRPRMRTIGLQKDTYRSSNATSQRHCHGTNNNDNKVMYGNCCNNNNNNNNHNNGCKGAVTLAPPTYCCFEYDPGQKGGKGYCVQGVQHDPVSGCHRVCERYKMRGNYNGVVRSQDTYQEKGVTPCSQYNYYRDEISYDCANLTSGPPCATYSPQLTPCPPYCACDHKPPVGGRFMSDLNTEEFGIPTSGRPGALRGSRSPGGPGDHEDLLARKKQVGKFTSKPMKSKSNEQMKAKSGRKSNNKSRPPSSPKKQVACKCCMENCRCKSDSPWKSHKKRADCEKECNCKESPRRGSVKLENESSSEIQTESNDNLLKTTGTREGSISADDDSGSDQEYSKETMRSMKKMKILPYMHNKRRNGDHSEVDGIKTPGSPKKGSPAKRKEKVYSEYINKYEKESHPDKASQKYKPFDFAQYGVGVGDGYDVAFDECYPCPCPLICTFGAQSPRPYERDIFPVAPCCVCSNKSKKTKGKGQTGANDTQNEIKNDDENLQGMGGGTDAVDVVAGAGSAFGSGDVSAGVGLGSGSTPGAGLTPGGGPYVGTDAGSGSGAGVGSVGGGPQGGAGPTSGGGPYGGAGSIPGDGPQGGSGPGSGSGAGVGSVGGGPYGGVGSPPSGGQYGDPGSTPGGGPYGGAGSTPGGGPYVGTGPTPGGGPYGGAGSIPGDGSHGGSGPGSGSGAGVGSVGGGPYGGAGSTPGGGPYGGSGSAPGGDPYGGVGPTPGGGPYGGGGLTPGGGPYGGAGSAPGGGPYGGVGSTPGGGPYGVGGLTPGGGPYGGAGSAPGGGPYGGGGLTPGGGPYGGVGSTPGGGPYGGVGSTPGGGPYGGGGLTPGGGPYGGAGSAPGGGPYGGAGSAPGGGPYGGVGSTPGGGPYGGGGLTSGGGPYGGAGSTPGGGPYGGNGYGTGAGVGSAGGSPHGSTVPRPGGGPYGGDGLAPGGGPHGGTDAGSGSGAGVGSAGGGPYGGIGSTPGGGPYGGAGSAPGGGSYGGTGSGSGAGVGSASGSPHGSTVPRPGGGPYGGDGLAPGGGPHDGTGTGSGSGAGVGSAGGGPYGGIGSTPGGGPYGGAGSASGGGSYGGTGSGSGAGVGSASGSPHGSTVPRPGGGPYGGDGLTPGGGPHGGTGAGSGSGAGVGSAGGGSYGGIGSTPGGGPYGGTGVGSGSGAGVGSVGGGPQGGAGPTPGGGPYGGAGSTPGDGVSGAGSGSGAGVGSAGGDPYGGVGSVPGGGHRPGGGPYGNDDLVGSSPDSGSSHRPGLATGAGSAGVGPFPGACVCPTGAGSALGSGAGGGLSSGGGVGSTPGGGIVVGAGTTVDSKDIGGLTSGGLASGTGVVNGSAGGGSTPEAVSGPASGGPYVGSSPGNDKFIGSGPGSTGGAAVGQQSGGGDIPGSIVEDKYQPGNVSSGGNENLPFTTGPQGSAAAVAGPTGAVADCYSSMPQRPQICLPLSGASAVYLAQLCAALNEANIEAALLEGQPAVCDPHAYRQAPSERAGRAVTGGQILGPVRGNQSAADICMSVPRVCSHHEGQCSCTCTTPQFTDHYSHSPVRALAATSHLGTDTVIGQYVPMPPPPQQQAGGISPCDREPFTGQQSKRFWDNCAKDAPDSPGASPRYDFHSISDSASPRRDFRPISEAIKNEIESEAEEEEEYARHAKSLCDCKTFDYTDPQQQIRPEARFMKKRGFDCGDLAQSRPERNFNKANQEESYIPAPSLSAHLQPWRDQGECDNPCGPPRTSCGNMLPWQEVPHPYKPQPPPLRNPAQLVSFVSAPQKDNEGVEECDEGKQKSYVSNPRVQFMHQICQERALSDDEDFGYRIRSGKCNYFQQAQQKQEPVCTCGGRGANGAHVKFDSDCDSRRRPSQVPEFTGCPCMLQTYLNMVTMYYPEQRSQCDESHKFSY